MLDEEDNEVRWERLIGTVARGFAILINHTPTPDGSTTRVAIQPKDIIIPVPSRKKKKQRQRPASVAAQKAMLGHAVAIQRGSVTHGTA